MHGHQVGIDIGGTKMLMIALRSGERRVLRVPTGRGASPEELGSAILGFVDDLPGCVDSLGIAVPGLVEGSGQVVSCDVLPRLVGWRIKDAFSGVTSRTAVANDAEAALVEEARDLAPGSNAAVVMVGTGIGAAFLVDGRIARGSRGWMGELGSIPIAYRDEVRTLDQLASGSAILARLGLDAVEFAARLASNEPGTLQAIPKAGMSLGLGLSIIINLFNPGLLALGGGTLAYPGYLESALACAERYTMPELWRACSVRQCVEGDFVVALGAVRLGTPSG